MDNHDKLRLRKPEVTPATTKKRLTLTKTGITATLNNPQVNLKMIYEAQEALKGFARWTDLLPASASFFRGKEIFIKAENLQRSGSFKVRGAYNRMLRLTDEERARGVICASAGNHAQGVALSARQLGIHACVVMPNGAPISKLEATRSYGAEVIQYGDSFNMALDKAELLQKQSGMVFIHAFDDPYIIAGQGTVGLEIISDKPDIKTIIVPVGGGGLAAGVALAVKEKNPDVKVVGVEPENAASMAESFRKGMPVKLDKCGTIADGVAVKQPGQLTFDICRRYLDDIITVSEEEIATTILVMLERMKMVVEGAGAVAMAALIGQRAFAGPVAAIISGGNIDVNILERVIEKGLINSGRHVRLVTSVTDKPGNLSKLLDLLAELEVNVLSVVHDRFSSKLSIGQAAVNIEIETRNIEHVERVKQVLADSGYIVDFT